MRIKFLSYVFSALGLLMTGCHSESNVSSVINKPTIPVIASVPIVKDLVVYVETIGTLQPSILMNIFPQIGGKLTDVLVKEGEWVQPGSVLFKIDSKSTRIRIREIEAQQTSDRATFSVLQKKMARYRDLAEKDLLAQAEWEDLEAQIERAKASLDLIAARLSAAELDLTHCTVRSPIQGRVGKLNVHPGNLISVGQPTPLVSISKLNPLIVEFHVTEKEFPKMHNEVKELEVTPLCSPEKRTLGKITFMDNHFDQKTGLLLVRAEVDNTNDFLRPGQTVRVLVPVSVEHQAILIPQKAVRYNHLGPFVYVVQEDMTVSLRQLLLGQEYGTDQVVSEGITPKEIIVHEGHLRLLEGSTVEVQP